jgi:hypothetical protein
MAVSLHFSNFPAFGQLLEGVHTDFGTMSAAEFANRLTTHSHRASVLVPSPQGSQINSVASPISMAQIPAVSPLLVMCRISFESMH